MTRQQSTTLTEPHHQERGQLRLACLTPRQMQCLSLYYYDGMSQDQIGGELGIGQRAVSQHLQYGQRKLAAVELSIRRRSVDVAVRIIHMDTDSLDRISAEDARAVW